MIHKGRRVACFSILYITITGITIDKWSMEMSIIEIDLVWTLAFELDDPRVINKSVHNLFILFLFFISM